MILIIPAIDLRGGKCVRLVQGEAGTEKIYSDDPVKMAIIWRGENFKTIHLVDLDGAFEGRLSNYETAKQIVDAVNIPVEYGGGVRTYEDAKKMVDAGVYRVIVGTAAVSDEDIPPEVIERFRPEKNCRRDRYEGRNCAGERMERLQRSFGN